MSKPLALVAAIVAEYVGSSILVRCPVAPDRIRVRRADDPGQFAQGERRSDSNDIRGVRGERRVVKGPEG